MVTTRLSRPLCQGTRALILRWDQQSKQCFFTSNFHSSASPSSPTMRKKVIRRSTDTNLIQNPNNSKATNNANDGDWPLGILLDAHKVGLLKITADAAVAIMRDFSQRQSLSTQQICETIEHDIRPNDITLLARVLLRTDRTTMARDMFMAAAKLHDEEAILFIMQEAIRRDSLHAPGVNSIYKGQFTEMVEREHPRALLLQCQLHERRGNHRQACCLYERFLMSDHTQKQEAENNDEFGDAWVALGKLRLRIKEDLTGAETAISKAALKYDNPTAYYELGKAFTKPSSAEYESYMLKAAASGEAEAAHELGKLYFGQAQGKVLLNGQSSPRVPTKATTGATEYGSLKPNGRLAPSPNTALEKRNLARQWFAIGADLDITGSQVYLAVLFHKLGKFVEGRQWLETASKSKNAKDWKKAIDFLAEKWTAVHFDFASMDIDALRKGIGTDYAETDPVS